MIKLLNNPQNASSVFGEWPETMIWSCLENVMGRVYGDDLEHPQSAAAFLGDFCFLAGKPLAALAAYKPEDCKQDFIIMVPPDGEWAEQIEKIYTQRAKKVFRYALKKEKDGWNPEVLKNAIRSMPDGFRIAPVDEKLYDWCRTNTWSRDLVSQFEDFDTYRRLGVGRMVLNSDGVPVSGASSYSRYSNGIEIEVDTAKEYRRKGLAFACSAALIQACCACGLYPGWDAQNLGSLALAEKLGYHFDNRYTAYEIYGY